MAVGGAGYAVIVISSRCVRLIFKIKFSEDLYTNQITHLIHDYIIHSSHLKLPFFQ